MFNLKKLTKQDIANKRCLVRVDYNSFENGKLKNPFRIKKSLPLINWLLENDAKVILMTHIEENSGNIPRLNDFFEIFKNNFFSESLRGNIHYSSGVLDEKTKEAVFALPQKNLLLLDNLRLFPEEKENDINFSQNLAALGEIYINEAFSVSHRMHSSIVGVPNFLPSFLGFNFNLEIENLSKFLNPPHPFLIFIGGKKVSTKEKVIKNFLEKADMLVPGGLMAAEFCYALGFNTGKTIINKNPDELINNGFLNNPKIKIPKEFIVLRDGKKENLNIKDVKDKDTIYDISPDFFSLIENEIKNSSLIFWNGPMGYLEQGFLEGTRKLIDIILKSKAELIAGGGDTVDYISSIDAENKFSFISTGGGAMLEFLAEGTLPGISVLNKGFEIQNQKWLTIK